MNKLFPHACLSALLVCTPQLGSAEEKPGGIRHDAEYDILLAQHADRWAADDQSIDAKLAALREKNGGKPPNIIYILIDDMGFGEIGMPDMAVTRGYKTPNLDAMAREGLSLQRMYTEPSCTPTRVAMMTGRLPVRTGVVEAKATLAGDGLPAEEVTLAEILRDAGYATAHVGKSITPKAFEEGNPKIRQLFPDPPSAERAYFKKTGLFPIMHAVAIRRDAIEVDPALPKAVFEMYSQAKQLAYANMETTTSLRISLPWVSQELEETRELMGGGFWRYGIEANRKELELVMRYTHEQGLVKRRRKFEEMFDPSTLALLG